MYSSSVAGTSGAVVGNGARVVGEAKITVHKKTKRLMKLCDIKYDLI